MIGIVTLRDSIYDESGLRDVLVGKVTRENGVYKVTESDSKYYTMGAESIAGICYTTNNINWEPEED